MMRGASRVRLRADFPRRGATIYGTMYSASKLHDALAKRILISLSLVVLDFLLLPVEFLAPRSENVETMVRERRFAALQAPLPRIDDLVSSK